MTRVNTPLGPQLPRVGLSEAALDLLVGVLLSDRPEEWLGGSGDQRREELPDADPGADGVTPGA